MSKKHIDEDLFSFLRTLLVAAVIAVVFRGFLFEPFSIPSGSMVPSLLVGDYLFVSKYSYGYSALSVGLGFLRNWFDITLPEGRLFARQPKQGDVVVFKLPRNGSTDYVKRLIGMPGDTVQVQHGRLYVNGRPVPREVTGAYTITGDDLEQDHEYFRRTYNVPAIQYKETLPNGVPHSILEISDEARLDNTGVFTVPPRHYFMMGDNRDNSLDSRVPMKNGVGFVPEENIVGRAEVVFFSLRAGSPFWQFWTWPSHLRLDRMLKAIT